MMQSSNTPVFAPKTSLFAVFLIVFPFFVLQNNWGQSLSEGV